MAHILYSQAWLREPFLIQVPQPQVIWNHQVNKHVESRFFQRWFHCQPPNFLHWPTHPMLLYRFGFIVFKTQRHFLSTAISRPSVPQNDECPLKINGWKMYLLFLLGDMLVFGGVNQCITMTMKRLFNESSHTPHNVVKPSVFSMRLKLKQDMFVSFQVSLKWFV